jgi:hypothetical protein
MCPRVLTTTGSFVANQDGAEDCICELKLRFMISATLASVEGGPNLP